MFIAFLSFASSTSLKAQCVDSYSNGIDCCVKVAVYDGSSFIGYVMDAGIAASIPIGYPCNALCEMIPGTTSSPATGTISTNLNCSVNAPQALSCNSNYEFRVVSIAGTPFLPTPKVSMSSKGPVSFSGGSCCGLGFHIEIVGTTLTLSYDCP